jgi:hypothetical protein
MVVTMARAPGTREGGCCGVFLLRRGYLPLQCVDGGREFRSAWPNRSWLALPWTRRWRQQRQMVRLGRQWEAWWWLVVAQGQMRLAWNPIPGCQGHLHPR